MTKGTEADRLSETYAQGGSGTWLHWGPYLSERQWGTVREDYSVGGDAWNYFPHDHAGSRTYRWGEDGLAGISDRCQQLCFALALWNGRDPILKERLFGLTNGEGNHGEDVKEYYFYLDNTPTHSYMKWLYKYPQAAFPYGDLVAENARRKQTDPHAAEYELLDTGVFEGDRYFDVVVEYAKAAADDITVRISVTNRGPDAADAYVLPTLWFRNTWAWDPSTPRPQLQGALTGNPSAGVATVRATYATAQDTFPPMTLYCLAPDDLLFAENDTNTRRLWGSGDSPAYPKDGINDHVVAGAATVNPARTGTKAAVLHRLRLGPGETREIRLRLTAEATLADPFGPGFDDAFTSRIAEADEFYASLGPAGLSDDRRALQRQAYAGMLWGKQFYNYVVRDWLEGDPAGPPPPSGRSRNAEWRHFYAADILSMPDKWEYPWFASWDLCFQSVVYARIDPQFAKQQLLTLAREFYMSPDGAVPAYEWAFSDVNPPLHAWAALRVFAMEKATRGGDGDLGFLSSIFRYCLTYFTWWANRKDPSGKDLFQGGFLGLDNISVVDRSHLSSLSEAIGAEVELYQSDGTSWMGLFSLHLMEMALTLTDHGLGEYAPLASKFFQHFVFIADALNSVERRADGQVSVWDDEDGFFYDVLRIAGDPDTYVQVRLRSLVGILALFPVASLDFSQLEKSASGELADRFEWFRRKHPELLAKATTRSAQAGQETHLLSFVSRDELSRVLSRVFDIDEFLGPHGIRSISRVYQTQPFELNVRGQTLTEAYEPAESAVGLFGGNSNWRGPVWFPINYLLVETLRRYHEFFGDSYTIEYPTRSGRKLTLGQIADDLANRLISTFERGADGTRPVYGGTTKFQQDPNFRDLLLFFEYFNGDNGAGLGASHQTGWTGLVAELLQPANPPSVPTRGAPQ